MIRADPTRPAPCSLPTSNPSCYKASSQSTWPPENTPLQTPPLPQHHPNGHLSAGVATAPLCQEVGSSQRVMMFKTKSCWHPGGQQRTFPHLRVCRRLLCKSSAIVEVFQFVLLINFVIAFASCAARHVLPHAIVTLLFLGGRKAGRWEGVKGQHGYQGTSDQTSAVTRS